MRQYTRRTPDQWQSLVMEQQSGALSAPQFCKQNNIGYASFCQWRKRLSQADDMPGPITPSFIEVTQAENQNHANAWAVELELGNHIVLRIARS